MSYEYPIDSDWSTEEIIQVIKFFETIEKAYESKIEVRHVLEAYKKFKEVVPSKAEEKTLFKQFEKQSSYIPYKVVKEAKQLNENDFISL